MFVCVGGSGAMTLKLLVSVTVATDGSGSQEKSRFSKELCGSVAAAANLNRLCGCSGRTLVILYTRCLRA